MNRRSFLAALPLVPAALVALSAKAEPEKLVLDSPGDYTLTEQEWMFRGLGEQVKMTRLLSGINRTLGAKAR